MIDCLAEDARKVGRVAFVYLVDDPKVDPTHTVQQAEAWRVWHVEAPMRTMPIASIGGLWWSEGEPVVRSAFADGYNSICAVASPLGRA